MYANQDNVVSFANPTNKIPPQCLEAEEAILGGILLDPDALARVRDRLKPMHFYITAHQDIYAASLRLDAMEKPTDFIALADYLESNGLLFKIGGRSKLIDLLSRCVSAVNIDALAELVISKWKRRQLGKLATMAGELQYKSDDEVPLDKAFEQLQTFVYDLQQGENPVGGTTHISSTMSEAFAYIEERNQGTVPSGIATGFYDLDAMMNGGFNRGDLIVVAGRPSMGKSAIAAQIGFYVAQTQNLPVVVFNMEMSKLAIALRALSAEANIESSYLRSGRISNDQWQPLTQAINDISSIPVYLNECATPSLTYFETECRRVMSMKRQNLGLIIVDYLQLMDGSASGTRNNEVAAITRGLKRLAMKLQVPIICLSQLSRAVESRPSKRPVLSDLRDSGGIEQDGDKVIMLYRDEYYHPDSPERGIAEVIISKHRDGPTGITKLLFDNQFVRFKNLARNTW
jgi:replicative DNA helicase